MTRIASIAVVLAVVAFGAPGEAQAQGRVKVGTLTCEMSGGIGLIVASRKELSCRFSPSERGWRREAYVGSVTRLGVDVGATAGGRLIWAVYAPTNAGRYALAGGYGGASAEATVGAGVGAQLPCQPGEDPNDLNYEPEGTVGSLWTIPRTALAVRSRTS